jgi:catechol 2,3-dioxygenase-like lactoylglutathione lyase family enzyme
VRELTASSGEFDFKDPTEAELRGLYELKGFLTRRRWQTLSMPLLDLVTIVVDDYDPAIEFFVDALGFELVDDSASLTNDGRPKRWVVVRPRGGETGILLARADGDDQRLVIGNQFAGRVGFFLRVDDFEASYGRMMTAGVEFLAEPRTEDYGRVAVFVDISGNRWDLIGPLSSSC